MERSRLQFWHWYLLKRRWGFLKSQVSRLFTSLFRLVL